jgi:hypothetical protein
MKALLFLSCPNMFFLQKLILLTVTVDRPKTGLKLLFSSKFATKSQALLKLKNANIPANNYKSSLQLSKNQNTI